MRSRAARRARCPVVPGALSAWSRHVRHSATLPPADQRGRDLHRTHASIGAARDDEHRRPRRDRRHQQTRGGEPEREREHDVTDCEVMLSRRVAPIAEDRRERGRRRGADASHDRRVEQRAALDRQLGEQRRVGAPVDQERHAEERDRERDHRAGRARRDSTPAITPTRPRATRRTRRARHRATIATSQRRRPPAPAPAGRAVATIRSARATSRRAFVGDQRDVEVLERMSALGE